MQIVLNLLKFVENVWKIIENVEELWKIMENVEKLWKILENVWKITENYGKCREITRNCGKLWKMYGKLLLRYFVQKSSCLYSFIEVILLRLNCVLVENLRKFRAHFIKFQGTFYIRCI